MPVAPPYDEHAALNGELANFEAQMADLDARGKAARHAFIASTMALHIPGTAPAPQASTAMADRLVAARKAVREGVGYLFAGFAAQPLAPQESSELQEWSRQAQTLAAPWAYSMKQDAAERELAVLSWRIRVIKGRMASAVGAGLGYGVLRGVARKSARRSTRSRPRRAASRRARTAARAPRRG